MPLWFSCRFPHATSDWCEGLVLSPSVPVVSLPPLDSPNELLTLSQPFLLSAEWPCLYIELWRVCSVSLWVLFWVIYTDVHVI